MFCWDRILCPLGVVFVNSGQSIVRCSRIDCGHSRQASWAVLSQRTYDRFWD